MNGNNGAGVREALERPFPHELIKQKPAAFGGSLSYIEGHEVIRRLNEALDGKWSFEVVTHQITDSEVFVVGKLQADGVIKMSFGGAEIKRRREDHSVISISDDLKAAETDSLKRCARQFGVALHLYGEPIADNGNGKSNGGNGTAPANGNGHAQSNGGNGDGNRLSSKQLGMILALARERNIGRDKLNQMVEERYNRRLEFLTRSEASFFIGELQAA